MLRRTLLLILLAGTAAIILISLGCDDLVTQTIKTTTAGNPTADFTATPDSGCIPLSVTFKDASSGPVATWIWNFGDESYDTLYAEDGDSGYISHIYTTSGSYTVTLSVFDTLDGSDAEVKKRAVIAGHNVDSVTLTDTLVCPSQEITFKAHNPYGVSTLRWAFGDGTVKINDSLEQTHSYDTAGLYEFRLTATGDCGSKVIIDTVHVLNCAHPYFTAEPDNGCVSFNVIFTDSSSPPVNSDGDTVGNIVHWKWVFGNGETEEYDQPSNSHEIEYTNAGIYPVTLTVTTDSGGVTSYTDTITAYTLSGEFDAQPTAACHVPGRQFLVSFTRQATGDIGWIWDFGDGDTSRAQNPYHAYTTPGYYNVTLKVLGACGDDTTTFSKPALIRYSDQLEPIKFSSQIMDTGWHSYTFIDSTAEDTVYTRLWTFGGVNGGNTKTINHTFPDAGSYVVKLTRLNDCDTLSDTMTVTVTNPTP
jgi:PKD repeat protein